LLFIIKNIHLTFEDFNFDEQLFEGLQSMGYRKPTAIQEQAIPLILDHKDLIACAQTGTGKTASYLLPVLQHISQSEKKYTKALILAPTRELAQQIDQQVEGLAYFAGISSIAVYGGGDGIVYEQQRRAMIDGVDIIIATPGRLIAQLASGVIKLTHLQYLVLDEADRMLDMGFYDDLLKIISYLPEQRQTLLFSATMPPKIRVLANTILKSPEHVNIALSQPAVGIHQQVYMTFDPQKIPLITGLLKDASYVSVIIFASRKETVKDLTKALRRVGVKAEAFHSDLEQDQRETILRAFKSRILPVIIGTDVLSRGIDIEGISLVINFDVPPDPEDYIHRIGRTARAETTGTAITFVNERDQRKFSFIEKLIGREIERMTLPEELGESPAYNPAAKSKSIHPKHKKSWGNKKKPQK
jgi:superfamily II DNA/RNA helicase